MIRPLIKSIFENKITQKSEYKLKPSQNFHIPIANCRLLCLASRCSAMACACSAYTRLPGLWEIEKLFTSGVLPRHILIKNHDDHIGLDTLGTAGNSCMNETIGRLLAFIAFLNVDKHGSWSAFVVIHKVMGTLELFYVTDSVCKFCNIHWHIPAVFNNIGHISKQWRKQQTLRVPCCTELLVIGHFVP